MTITIKSVFENTVVEVSDVIGRAYWHEVVCAVSDAEGEEGLRVLENNVTMLHETGNVEGLLDYIEEVAEDFSVEF